MRLAGRRELGLVAHHAGGHAANIGDIRTAEPERIAGAGLLLFGGVGLTGGGPDRNRQRGGQQQSELKMSCSKNRHPFPPAQSLAELWVNGSGFASTGGQDATAQVSRQSRVAIHSAE